MSSRLRRGTLAAAALSLVSMAAMPAMAQHVVTEDEAAKLTLEALTAPPRPVYRPVIRASYRTMARGHARHGFERAAYHPAHHATSHHRHRR